MTKMRGRHEAVTVEGVGGGELVGGVECVECVVPGEQREERRRRRRETREVWWSGVRMVEMVSAEVAIGSWDTVLGRTP